MVYDPWAKLKSLLLTSSYSQKVLYDNINKLYCVPSEQVDENHSKTIEFGEFLTLMSSETWDEIEKGEIIKVC